MTRLGDRLRDAIISGRIASTGSTSLLITNFHRNTPHRKRQRRLPVPANIRSGAPHPRFPVRLGGLDDLHAPFLERKAHTRLSLGAACRKFGASRSCFARCGIPRCSTRNSDGCHEERRDLQSRFRCHKKYREQDGCPRFAKAYSGFPVELACVGELHAAFLNESRTSGRWWRPVQESRIRGPKTMGRSPSIAFARALRRTIATTTLSD
jgi:hypothetical protein